MLSPDNSLLFCLALPFVAAILTAILPRIFAEAVSFISAVITFALAIMLFGYLNQGEVASLVLGELVPELGIHFKLDALGLTFALLASGLWILATVFSFGYVRDNSMQNLRRYFACFAISIGAALGIAFAANLFTFLIFFEALTLATYPLVVHKETQGAISAGRRYLAFSLTGGLLTTTGVIWLWSVSESLDFQAGGFVSSFSNIEMNFALLLLVSGCLVKSAVMPFHSWLPAAMVAPSPVSALLHAVAVVKAGVFGCLRITGFVFKPELIDGSLVQSGIIFLGATTIVVGSLMALRQKNLKRRLAYSTIVHLSYIVLGAFLLTDAAYTGAILHMVNHGLTKVTLFFCAGAIFATTRFTEIDQLKGIGRRMPFTMTAFTIASLGLIGVPGFCVSVSKHQLIEGAANYQIVEWIMSGASVFTALYLLPIIYIAFFGKAEEVDASSIPVRKGEARFSMCFPLLITALLVIAFGSVGYLVDRQVNFADQVTEHVFSQVVKKP